jgi:hypothetical protein
MRTSNIERRTLNVEQKRAKGTAGTTRLSLCGSKFDVGERSIPAIGPGTGRIP